MLALFLGPAIVTLVAFLAGEYVAKGRQSMIYSMTVGARSASTGVLYLFAGVAVSGLAMWLLIWLLQSLF
jgi:hypothetical protein